MNLTIFSGNIGSVKPVATVENSKVLNFTVASDKHFKDREGKKVVETTWYECSLWNRENVYPFLKPGTHVVIQGEPSARAYIDKKDPQKAVAVLTCTVENIEFHNLPANEE